MTSITFIVNYFMNEQLNQPNQKQIAFHYECYHHIIYSHSLVAWCALCSLLAVNKQCNYNAWRVMYLESTNWVKTFCTVETWQKMFRAHSMNQPVQSISTFKICLHINNWSFSHWNPKSPNSIYGLIELELSTPKS